MGAEARSGWYPPPLRGLPFWTVGRSHKHAAPSLLVIEITAKGKAGHRIVAGSGVHSSCGLEVSMASPWVVIEPEQVKVDFKRILVATDFSTASERALAHALPIAARYDAEVLLAHALHPVPRQLVPVDPLPELSRDRRLAEREMMRFELELEIKALPHRVLIERGSVWDVLAAMIERDQPGLLVLGTRGRSALKALVLGSVAEQVIRRAACPVLTVGPMALSPSSEVASFRSILFATDFGPASNKALLYAVSLAEDCQAKLTLLHMIPTPPISDYTSAAYSPAAYEHEDLMELECRMHAEGLRKLRELIPADAKLRSQPECLITTESGGILQAAATQRAELIILGANQAQAPRLAAHIPWTVTHHVLCGASCPVLTVKG